MGDCTPCLSAVRSGGGALAESRVTFRIRPESNLVSSAGAHAARTHIVWSVCTSVTKRQRTSVPSFHTSTHLKYERASAWSTRALRRSWANCGVAAQPCSSTVVVCTEWLLSHMLRPRHEEQWRPLNGLLSSQFHPQATRVEWSALPPALWYSRDHDAVGQTIALPTARVGSLRYPMHDALCLYALVVTCQHENERMFRSRELILWWWENV